jgi:hypothetical protein
VVHAEAWMHGIDCRVKPGNDDDPTECPAQCALRNAT